MMIVYCTGKISHEMFVARVGRLDENLSLVHKWMMVPLTSLTEKI